MNCPASQPAIAPTTNQAITPPGSRFMFLLLTLMGRYGVRSRWRANPSRPDDRLVGRPLGPPQLERPARRRGGRPDRPEDQPHLDAAVEVAPLQLGQRVEAADGQPLGRDVPPDRAGADPLIVDQAESEVAAARPERPRRLGRPQPPE